MGRVKDREFWESAIMNNTTFIQHYNRLTELAISMFEWTNLPETVDPRFMELALFTDGKAVFFKDDVLGFLCLRTTISGRFDVYRVPIERRAFASNGYNKELTIDDSVIIFNNHLREGNMLDVQNYSKRLYNLDRIIDVNANAQKTPVLIACPENRRLTLKNAYQKWEGNEPVIYGDDTFKGDELKVLRTDAPYMADKIQDLKREIFDEAMTYLGIPTIGTHKRERLIVAEVKTIEGGASSFRYSRLACRQEACKKINKMFGLNIWCDFRGDISLEQLEKDTAGEYSVKEGDELV